MNQFDDKFVRSNSEAGVTLVVAVVLLAVVTSISFALSAVIIREIRGTQILLKTEPAISGAYSGGEIGMYRFIRGLGGTDTSGSTPQSGATYVVQSDLYDNPFLFSTANGDELLIGLYDAGQPSNQNANYGAVTIRNDSGSDTVSVEIYSWGDPDTVFCQTNLSGGSSFTCSALSKPDDRYIISLDPVSVAGSATGDLTATDNGGSPKGVPSENPGIDTTGSKDDVQRKLEIRF